MADTIIERNTRADTDSSGGWAVAVVVLIAVVVLGGLFLYYHRGAGPALPNTGAPSGTNVNVTLPGGSGGGASGGTTGGATGGATY